jgi:hypothetical protein
LVEKPQYLVTVCFGDVFHSTLCPSLVYSVTASGFERAPNWPGASPLQPHPGVMYVKSNPSPSAIAGSWVKFENGLDVNVTLDRTLSPTP